MFTGLIERIGKIIKVEQFGQGKRFLIDAGEDFEVKDGDSVAIDGVCLTVSGQEENSFWVEASPETLAKTTLAQKTSGDEVNLERALEIGARLGGHFVLGHIDGIGIVRKTERRGEFMEMEIEAPKEVATYLVQKGSIAVDGISLTINEVRGNFFTVMLIPETLKRTTISKKRPGMQVNLEADIIGKYVEKFLQLKSENLTLEKLKELGF